MADRKTPFVSHKWGDDSSRDLDAGGASLKPGSEQNSRPVVYLRALFKVLGEMSRAIESEGEKDS